MNTAQQFTHKGWFGFCPARFADLESDAPVVDARHWSLLPLLTMSEWFFQAYFWLRTWADPTFEPEWPLRITGEYKI